MHVSQMRTGAEFSVPLPIVPRGASKSAAQPQHLGYDVAG